MLAFTVPPARALGGTVTGVSRPLRDKSGAAAEMPRLRFLYSTDTMKIYPIFKS